MNDVAVVKPDHLGDFILSVPAIRALLRRFRSISYFAPSANRFLADHFTPEVTFEPTAMQHLQKDGRGLGPEALVDRLKRFRLVIFLREDGVLQQVARQLDAMVFIERGSHDVHETRTQASNVSRVIGEFSRREMFPEPPATWPHEPRSIGLCVSAGFHANKWPLTLWAALGRRLIRERGAEISVIGGPKERDELEYLGRVLGLSRSRIVEGSLDLGEFRSRVGACDVVVGTDSGTLHLVSTAAPVLGIFTASPWRRFAPFGPANRVLTAEVACSPCMQFSSTHYNACLTRECAMLIEPDAVFEALMMPARNDREVRIGPAKLFFDPAGSGTTLSSTDGTVVQPLTLAHRRHHGAAGTVASER